MQQGAGQVQAWPGGAPQPWASFQTCLLHACLMQRIRWTSTGRPPRCTATTRRPPAPHMREEREVLLRRVVEQAPV